MLALSGCLLAGLVGVAPAANAETPDSPAVLARSVWVPLEVEGAVQQIDPVTHSVVRTITGVGSNPFTLIDSPDHTKIYASRLGTTESTMPVIDKKSGRVIKEIPTFGSPYTDMRIPPNSRELYLSTLASVVQVVNTDTDTVVRTLPIAVPPVPGHVEVSPDNKTLYVLGESGFLTAYDSHSGAVRGTPLFLGNIQTGWGGLTSDGKTMYVRTLTDVSVVDIASWRITRTIDVGGIAAAPFTFAFTPDQKQLWVANYGNNTMSVIDLARGQVIKTIQFPDGMAVGLGFSPDGRKAYVSNVGPTAHYPFPAGAISKLGVLMLNNGPGSLDVFDTKTFERVDRIATGRTPLLGVYPTA